MTPPSASEATASATATHRRGREELRPGFPLTWASGGAYTARVRITVNGEAREVPEGSTVAALLDALSIGRARVAVERNREIVPRAEHAQAQLCDGDRVELLTFVGGG